MSRTSESHAVEIASAFTTKSITKYDKGQMEHGGRFWRKPTLNYMEEEVIDMWAYLHVHREHVKQIIYACDNFLAYANSVGDVVDVANNGIETIKQIRNVLEKGNPEGQSEEEKQ